MNIITLSDYFKEVGYDYQKDYNDIKTICFYTKTRVGTQYELEDFVPSRGSEQTFLIKCILEKYNAKSFFEIGTGRGTACYAAALCDDVENVTTIDIVPHDSKKNEAIGGKPAYVSNKDLYGMIPYEQKSKIDFLHRSNIPQLMSEKAASFDVCFIDGNHDNPQVILEDYMICKRLTKTPGVIIWDDYDLDKFKVKDVIDQIAKTDTNVTVRLINFRGYMFGTDNPEKTSGTVLMEISA